VTCHDSRHLAMEAGEAGADYVAFGAFFPTAPRRRSTADPRSSAGGRPVRDTLRAIGGITPENGRVLVEAGADFLAVSNAVWSHPEGPAAAVKAFQQVLSP
jgi:thiamine-phosphate pyrophosphorylase